MIKLLKKYKELILLIIILSGLFVYFYMQITSGKEYVGKWYLVSAKQDNKDVELSDLYGTGFVYYGGILTLNEDMSYTEYIGVYSEDQRLDYEGTYKIKKNKIYLTSRSGMNKTLEIVKNNSNVYLKELIEDNIYIFFEKNEKFDYLEESNSDTSTDDYQQSNDTDQKYDKYIGSWTDKDDLDNIVIKEVQGNEVVFDLSFFRIVSYDNLVAHFISDNEAEFTTKTTLSGDKFSGVVGVIKFNDDNITLEIKESSVEDIVVGSTRIFAIK